jgi:hypothetical protein
MQRRDRYLDFAEQVVGSEFEVVALENGVRGGQHAVDDAKIATAEFAHELG